MVKFSALPVSLYADFASGERTLGDWFHFAATLGLNGADISVAHLQSLSNEYLDSLRREAEEAGVQIAMIATYSDFTHPDAQERMKQRTEVKSFIDAAARLGASFVRVTAGQRHPGVNETDGIAWAVAGLTSCLEYASAAGITLTYENHTKGSVWTYYDFTQPARLFLEVMQRTAGTELRLLYDTANTLGSGDDPLAVLAQVQDRIDVIHVNDIRRAGYFEPCLIGTGVAPIREILKILAEAEFDGWISVEEASLSGEDGFRRAIPYVKQLWTEVSSLTAT